VVAVVRGAPSPAVQILFGTLVEQWRPFVRVAGVVAETHGLADRACNSGYPGNLATAERFSLSQYLW
jgi:hypothetical protein